MIKSKTTSGNIKVCSNAYHEAPTLYNGCKDNLLLFSDSYKIPSACEGSRDLSETDNSPLNSRLYLLNIALEDMHKDGIVPGKIARQRYFAIKEIEPKRLNRDISRIYSQFDPDKPIDHVVWAKLYDMKLPERWNIPISDMNRIGVDRPDNYRLKIKRAMQRAGLKNGVLFGVDVGDNGLYHLHSLTQGHIKPHRFVLARTGIGYIKIPNDRKEYFEIDEKEPNHILGFHTTCGYCLEKHYPNKKAFLRISS